MEEKKFKFGEKVLIFTGGCVAPCFEYGIVTGINCMAGHIWYLVSVNACATYNRISFDIWRNEEELKNDRSNFIIEK